MCLSKEVVVVDLRIVVAAVQDERRSRQLEAGHSWKRVMRESCFLVDQMCDTGLVRIPKMTERGL